MNERILSPATEKQQFTISAALTKAGRASAGLMAALLFFPISPCTLAATNSNQTVAAFTVATVTAPMTGKASIDCGRLIRRAWMTSKAS